MSARTESSHPARRPKEDHQQSPPPGRTSSAWLNLLFLHQQPSGLAESGHLSKDVIDCFRALATAAFDDIYGRVASGPGCPVEIRSGALWREASGRYTIQAATADGPRTFRDAELQDDQSGVVPALKLSGSDSAEEEPLDAPVDPWETAVDAAVDPKTRAEALQVCAHLAPERAAELVVSELERGPALEWLDALASAAARLQYRGELRRRAKAALRASLHELIATRDADRAKTTWSLLRTYASLLSSTELDDLLPFLSKHGLLDTRQVTLQRIPHVLHSGPPRDTDTLGPLADRVHSLAMTFLNPDVIAPGESASLAINAVHALAALGDPRAADCIEGARALNASWVTRQLRRKLEETIEGWRRAGVDVTALEAWLARLT